MSISNHTLQSRPSNPFLIGDVYAGINILTDEAVVIKFEDSLVQYPLLDHEFRVYKELLLGNPKYLPSLKWYGRENHYNILVLERLGQSVQGLVQTHPQGLGIQRALRLGGNMVRRNLQHIPNLLMILAFCN